ncbi:Alpha-crystallin A chain [Channa argus]|uniref:Alpha-crystallin A chain n=1 Tax=Channa argus TaxID=215402 RepID=A0A6G1QBS3_CHAAH|nr:Alpha-crystallin A chain [Channa argus]KAK2893269.1 hypothetical protein Q8A73_015753 [Channa argus]
MSQHAALTNLFGDDPFFSQERLLWPLHHKALSSLQQDFFNRRAKLADSLLKELHDGHPLVTLNQLPLISSTLTRLNDDAEQQQRLTSSTELHKEAQQATDNNSDLLVTLDARGYSPNDITVKLEGRTLAVVAMKQAAAEDSQSCSSSTSSASFCSAAASQAGFVQKINLPTHLDLSGLSCSLMDDGQLQIHAPVTKQPISEERQVPIRFRTSLEFPITKEETEEKPTD